jgi:hypothetical protein
VGLIDDEEFWFEHIEKYSNNIVVLTGLSIKVLF